MNETKALSRGLVRTMAIFFYRLDCSACRESEVLSRYEAERRLQAHKKLRAGVETDEALLDELVPVLLGQISCRYCGRPALKVTVQPDVGEWSDEKRCVGCGQLIPASRLALLPDTEMCTTCQAAIDKGETPGPPVFCQRCGSPMQLRTRQIGGRTRYLWICSRAPKCPYWTDRLP